MIPGGSSLLDYHFIPFTNIVGPEKVTNPRPLPEDLFVPSDIRRHGVSKTIMDFQGAIGRVTRIPTTDRPFRKEIDN